jgi:hypothetical protein
MGDRLTLYCNDEVTVLDDPPPVSAEECESLSDIIPLSEPPGSLDLVVHSNDLPSSGDSFESGIFEVYGPASKRPRLLDVDSRSSTESHILETPLSPRVPILPTPMDRSNPPVPDSLPPSHVPRFAESNDPDVPPTLPVRDDDVPVPAVATLPDRIGDDHTDVDNSLPGTAIGGPMVTQDEKLSPAVLYHVSQQLSRVAEELKLYSCSGAANTGSTN